MGQRYIPEPWINLKFQRLPQSSKGATAMETVRHQRERERLKEGSSNEAKRGKLSERRYTFGGSNGAASMGQQRGRLIERRHSLGCPISDRGLQQQRGRLERAR
ncbi:hypothetical protein AMTR_s00054p00027360 [Amborella trichopoda]|uniref:Uncharacterized protein n=1 Tax=Amborella trichopoda TaxID=13333 RepID=U5DCJ5_AMBTC|nr:hypothetical protein AMTR_s00054p00027360 [Amborella trichopoda]